MQLRPTMFFRAAADGGQRLYIHHVPSPGVAVRGALVHVPPLMEEMNKSRRMVARASRALAAQGWAVLQVDLKGCGDSSGDFGEATWQDWIEDLAHARRWMQAQHPDCPMWWWGLRAGALQIGTLLAEADMDGHLLLWQPAVKGSNVLTQLLRLKAAASLMEGRSKEVIELARSELAAGRPLDVAGYAVHPALAKGLISAQLSPVATTGRRQLLWLETAPAGAELSPASHQACGAWRQAGWTVHAQAVMAPAFWQTAELEDAPALIEATVQGLEQFHAAH